jgi:hypothetical protein
MCMDQLSLHIINYRSRLTKVEQIFRRERTTGATLRLPLPDLND